MGLVFPAPAGMNRQKQQSDHQFVGIPRTRGDEPAGDWEALGPLRIPRTRGDEPSGSARGRGRFGYSPHPRG
jgi:hypothetical protein